MADGEELALVVLNGVDAVHHRLIGGEDASGCVIVLLLAQIRHRQIGQQVHKAALGLGDEGVAVSEKEHVLYPAALQQHLHERYDRPGLAGAGGHDQQGLAAVLLAEGLAHGLDGALLIVASGNAPVDLDVFQAGAHGAQVEELL